MNPFSQTNCKIYLIDIIITKRPPVILQAVLGKIPLSISLNTKDTFPKLFLLVL